MNGHEYYFVVAENGKKSKQTQFYPTEMNEMNAWIRAYKSYGWTVRVRPMNFDERSTDDFDYESL